MMRGKEQMTDKTEQNYGRASEVETIEASARVAVTEFTADDVRENLRRRYPATQMMGTVRIPGQWVTLSEWKEIDLLAIGVTRSTNQEWIAHEVKVSRSDYRSELKQPHKRDAYKIYSHCLYFAVPDGLLKPEEIAFEEPDWVSERCAGIDGVYCDRHYNGKTGHHSKVYTLVTPTEQVEATLAGREPKRVKCPTCDGCGDVGLRKLLDAAPQLWVPRDVGLITVNGRGSRIVKEAPRYEFGGEGNNYRRYRETGDLAMREVADIVRWASARPDPRHDGLVEQARIEQKELREQEREWKKARAAA